MRKKGEENRGWELGLRCHYSFFFWVGQKGYFFITKSRIKLGNSRITFRLTKGILVRSNSKVNCFWD
jgi:hypothetical protein